MRAPPWRIDAAVAARLHREARAETWGVTAERFASALDTSARKYFGDQVPTARDIERYLQTLHVADLAVACACTDGSEAAWDYFVREYRPVLYRAADSLDAGGGARELADSLYGELFGLTLRDGVRRSHLDYYHGRSALGTWLRAVLSQRFVDRVRGARRSEPLPDDDGPHAVAAGPPPATDAHWVRALELVRTALRIAVAALVPRDRLRLSCYYAQSMTLAQIGRLLNEHEATVSRHLTRTRKALRQDIERHLREQHRMSDAEIGESLSAVADNAGTLDLAELLGPDDSRKEAEPERSKG
jgi:RNA polymerase sigma-70 factor